MSPVVRELRVTDIRCHVPGCGAGPGQNCGLYGSEHTWVHQSRVEEFEVLVAAGWEWQEALYPCS